MRGWAATCRWPPGALRDAAARAAERFDHAAAEALLDDALQPASRRAEAWLDRARVRTRRGRYRRRWRTSSGPRPAGAAALEVGAWACYFDRRFAQAAQFAADGALAAADAADPGPLPGRRRPDPARGR